MWLGNFRGNRYSRNHTTLNPDKDEAKFWDFSWHEMGTIDLPHIIDFILAKTGFSDMLYVGHSQGTTAFFVMGSERPEYNKKIKAQFSLAPVAYMNHMFNPFFKFVAFFDGPVGFLTKLLGMHELLANEGLLGKIASKFCQAPIMADLVCKNMLFLIGGFNEKQMNVTLLPEILQHTPAGSSTKQLLHFAQSIKSCK